MDNESRNLQVSTNNNHYKMLYADYITEPRRFQQKFENKFSYKLQRKGFALFRGAVSGAKQQGSDEARRYRRADARGCRRKSTGQHAD